MSVLCRFNAESKESFIFVLFSNNEDVGYVFLISSFFNLQSNKFGFSWSVCFGSFERDDKILWWISFCNNKSSFNKRKHLGVYAAAAPHCGIFEMNFVQPKNDSV